MATNLLFIDRIKVLCQYLSNGKNFGVNMTRSYEVKMLASLMRRGSQQSPLFSLPAIKIVATVAAPRVSAGANRLWWDNHGSDRNTRHTRSNLG